MPANIICLIFINIFYAFCMFFVDAVHCQYGVCSTDILIFNPNDNINVKFIHSFMLSTKFVNDASANISGVNLPRVSTKYLLNYILPLPPLPEQHRIVAKLEELFSQLDSAVAALLKAKDQIKTYKQSVLSAAFSGKLTSNNAECKMQNVEDNVECKMQNVEDNVECKMQNVKCGMNEETGLPEGWKWVKLSDFVFQVKDGTHDTPKYFDQGIPFITQKNITKEGLSFENIRFISDVDHEKFYKRSNVFRNDILVSMIGANRGMSCIVKSDKIFSIKNVGLIKLDLNMNSPKYVDYYFKSPIGQKLILKESKGGAQQFIGLTELRNWDIISCSIKQQQQIVSEIEARFSEAENLEKTIDMSLAQAESLRQSILKKAFEGRLAPQDPNDEPASLLLERIKQEKLTGRAKKS